MNMRQSIQEKSAMPMLIVHSDRFVKEADELKAQLKDLIDVSLATSYDEANSQCLTTMPDLILAQSELPDGNAFDFCTRIRLLQDQKMTPLIVFSEKPDKKERVRTFQVGADEYISDLDFEYIKALVKHELDAKRQFDKLEQEKQQASNLVMEAMKSSSELGNAINFIERCHRFQDNEEISREIINFCRGLDLSIVIGVLEADHWQFSSSSGNVTKLEQGLMQSVHSHDRIVDFGVRTQLNWSNIALLIKNMPLRDPEKYGRIKDLLPTLLSSANVRIHSLFEEQQIKEQTTLMTRSIEALQPSIEEVITSMAQDNKNQRQELSDFLQKIVIALPGLGLEDDQEEFFISRVEALINNADEMANRSEIHQETLQKTNQVLMNLLVKQTEIHEMMSHPVEIAEKLNENEDDLFELF
jgi:CheY-like chemotaxis protein